MSHLSLARKQTKVLRAIRECQLPLVEPPNIGGILETIKDFDPDDVEFALGHVGRALWSFNQEVELSHPDMTTLLRGQLISDSEGSFSRVAEDTLRLVCCASKIGIGFSVTQAIKDFFTEHLCYRTCLEDIGSPSAIQRHVRFVPDRKDRDAIRRTKECQRVSGDFFAHYEIWTNYRNFDFFHRGVNRFQCDIEMAEEKLKHFRDLNLVSMAAEIENSLSRMKQQSCDDQYYRFNKIDIATASMMLAKVNGFEFVDDVIVMRPESLPNYRHFDTRASFEYAPRLYPYWVWQDQVPKRVKQIVDLLEEYPEAYNKPLFDHYNILFPGLGYSGLKYTTHSGDLVEFKDVWDTHENLDKHLTENKDLVPILLGEREGEHYFICYWM